MSGTGSRPSALASAGITSLRIATLAKAGSSFMGSRTVGRPS